MLSQWTLREPLRHHMSRLVIWKLCEQNQHYAQLVTCLRLSGVKLSDTGWKCLGGKKTIKQLLLDLVEWFCLTQSHSCKNVLHYVQKSYAVMCI